jgi:hypothetical protein
LKEEALDRTMWRNRFGGGFEPVVRQNTECMNVPLATEPGIEDIATKFEQEYFRCVRN